MSKKVFFGMPETVEKATKQSEPHSIIGYQQGLADGTAQEVKVQYYQ